jgi:hypothetical protein
VESVKELVQNVNSPHVQFKIQDKHIFLPMPIKKQSLDSFVEALFQKGLYLKAVLNFTV